jgi:hypothetical protein
VCAFGPPPPPSQELRWHNNIDPEEWESNFRSYTKLEHMGKIKKKTSCT